MTKLGTAFHPSEFINEELAERGWTLRDLVFRMRRYTSEEEWAVNMLAWQIYMGITDDPRILLGEAMARDLGRAFGVSGQTFLNMHEMWRKDQEPRS